MSNDPQETMTTGGDDAVARTPVSAPASPTDEARAALIDKAVALADATVREIRADAALRDVRGDGVDHEIRDTRTFDRVVPVTTPSIEDDEDRRPEKMPTVPGPEDLPDIQGIVYSGWGDHKFGGYLFATIHEGEDAQRAGRRWLAQLLEDNEVSSAKVSSAAPGPRLNLALSYHGLRKLGVPAVSLEALPQEAKRGMNNRARILGDDHPKTWELGANNELDVLVMVFARTDDERKALMTRHREALEPFAHVRPDELTHHLDGKEHFGFADGVSQPRLPKPRTGKAKADTAADDQPAPAKEPPIATGEILLGYRNAYGMLPASPKLPVTCPMSSLPSAASASPPAVATSSPAAGSTSSVAGSPRAIGSSPTLDAGSLASLASVASTGASSTTRAIGSSPALAAGSLPSLAGAAASAAASRRPPKPFDLGKNGTYLVFRKLEQHVETFWKYVRDQAEDLEPNNPRASTELTELLAAKMVGRWKSGASLVRTPDRDDKRFATPEQINKFGYHELDPHGDRCPISSHVRRANPRDARGDDPKESRTVVERHRILRRGRSYGTPLPDSDAYAGKGDGQPRGLYFICLQSSIARGFEFIQQTWLSNPGFGGLFCEPDPIMGNSDGDCDMTIPMSPLRLRLPKVPIMVTVKGGGYFLMPSLSALARIAAG